jgi:hypothetical protein
MVVIVVMLSLMSLPASSAHIEWVTGSSGHDDFFYLGILTLNSAGNCRKCCYLRRNSIPMERTDSRHSETASMTPFSGLSSSVVPCNCRLLHFRLRIWKIASYKQRSWKLVTYSEIKFPHFHFFRIQMFTRSNKGFFDCRPWFSGRLSPPAKLSQRLLPVSYRRIPYSRHA